MSNSIPPHYEMGEKAILGSLLLDDSAIHKVSSIVSVNDFHSEQHRNIYSACLSLANRGVAIDLATLTAELKGTGSLEASGGVNVLVELIDKVPSAANVAFYCRIVKEKSVLRQLISASQAVIARCYQGENEEYEHILRDVENISLKAAHAQLGTNSNAGMPRPISALMHETLRDIEDRFTRRVSPYGVRTGFSRLDAMTGGFRPGELVIVAGRPGMGKTAFVLAVASHTSDDAPTILFSLEMDSSQNVQRLLSRGAAVNLRHIRSGQLSQSDFDRIVGSAGQLSDAAMWIDETATVTPAQIRFRVRSTANQHKIEPGLIIVDYLQLMSPTKKQGSREQDIASISREMKFLAKDLGCPVIVLSQLNRELEKRSDKRPILSDLRESGAIEQDADVVVGLYQPFHYTDKDEDKGKVEAIVLKQRNGPTGTVPLMWVPETATFWDA